MPLSFDPHEKAGFFVVAVPLIGHVISHIIKSTFIIDQCFLLLIGAGGISPDLVERNFYYRADGDASGGLRCIGRDKLH